jgi:hypothetical protein
MIRRDKLDATFDWSMPKSLRVDTSSSRYPAAESAVSIGP